jgi:hypothetical protein
LNRNQVSQGLDAAGVVIMAMGNQEVFDLLELDPTSLDIGEKLLLRISAAGIHQGGMAVKIDEIDGGIFRGGASAPAYLKYFFGYVHALRHSLAG